MAVLLFLAGATCVALTLRSAVRTVVLPRAASAALTRAIFVGLRRLFQLRLRFTKTYEDRDRVMALYGPLALLLLPVVWLALILGGYTAMFLALDVGGLERAFLLSGSSLFTLGTRSAPNALTSALSFSEAAIGIGTIALLITYLPSIYAAFSRREILVTRLEVWAGAPPSGEEMLVRYTTIHGLEELEEVWTAWEAWFADIEETHITLPALVFFRSPQPGQSWVTAAGAILDAASLLCATIRSGRDPRYPTEEHTGMRHPRAALCIRAGWLSLQRIADFFDVPYETDLRENDPEHVHRIAIEREEFDEVWDRLARAGAPLVEDRERAWQDFAGWRVNYEAVLLALASITMPPWAPWSSDRAPSRPPRRRRRARRR